MTFLEYMYHQENGPCSCYQCEAYLRAQDAEEEAMNKLVEGDNA